MIQIVAALLLQGPAPSLTPLQKLDYFTGKWAFEWIAPESPLGPAGKITGTETCRKVLDGRFLECDIEGRGPAGPFTARALMGYDERDKAITRHEFDSSGAVILKKGPMGGDAGGWNTVFWESTPFFRDGRPLRLRGSTNMYSPVSYRLRLEISVDGGPFTSFGSPWYKKQDRPTP